MSAADKRDADHVYPDDDEDDDESFDDDEDRRILRPSTHENDDEYEELEDLNSPSPSSSDYEGHKISDARSQSALVAIPPPITASSVATSGHLAVVAPADTHSLKSQRIISPECRKPAAAIDDSRRLFQRLWTDEDELGLLQGFLEYTTQRRQSNSSSHHDTTSFYDQIKNRLQLDFNKNQLVEKLRRLKKKYRNVLSRIGSGKEFSFKSPHDHATFEISRRIWSTPSAVSETFDDEDGNLNIENASNPDRKAPKSSSRPQRKRSAVALDENMTNDPLAPPHLPPPVIPSSLEDIMRSCLSPLFKEIFYCTVNGPTTSGIMSGLALNPLPLNFCGSAMNSGNFEGIDEKWRKQQILELEVYSKRLELVQDQIKSTLDDLRSMEGRAHY